MSKPGALRRQWWPVPLVLGGLGVLCCARLGLILGGRWVDRRFGPLPSLGALAVVMVCLVLYRRWANVAVTRWVRREGWSAVTGRQVWPWTTDGTASPVVRRALTRTLDGRAITVGEVSWAPGETLGLGGEGAGRGLFVVLRLGRAYPHLIVRRTRHASRERMREEFFRRYWIECDDFALTSAIVGTELRSAHAAGRFADWMITGDELCLVQRRWRPMTPHAAQRLVTQADHIAALLARAPCP